MLSVLSSLHVNVLVVGKDRSNAHTREKSSHCASVSLQYKVCRDLSNLPQLLRQKWKFDIPLLYKGYLPPAGFSKGVYSFLSFFRGEEKSLLRTCTGLKQWAKGKKEKT